MFGYDRCWWYGLTVFIIFIGLNLLVWALRNKPKTSYALAWLIAAYLFISKVGSYVHNQCVGNNMDFPVEFSALSYFAYAILVLFGGRKIDHYGAFVAIVAGGVYSAASWLAPSNFAHEQGMMYIFDNAVFNHHVMYLGGMLLVANCRRYRVKDTWWHMALGVGAFVGYSWLIYSCTPYAAVRGKPLIINITDGGILTKVFAPEQINVGIRIGYYIFAVGILVLLLVGFYLLNYWQVKRRVKVGLPPACDPKGLAIFTDLVGEWRRSEGPKPVRTRRNKAK